VAGTVKSFRKEDDRPIKLLFQDEGRFGRISDPAHCWAPNGIRPIVPTHIVREYTHVFSAVCPQDGQSFSLILPYADTDAMKIFLEECSKYFKDNRVIMVMDQAAWHRVSEIDLFENIRIIYQPPYSPELNPVEHLWEYIRENYMRNCIWPCMEALEQALERILKNIMDRAETIQSIVGFHWAIL
jgi:hypothetical protein